MKNNSNESLENSAVAEDSSCDN